MHAEEFRAFVKAASARAVQAEGHISRLVLTQTTENFEPKIREPEMRHAMAQEAESMTEEVFYGIEVPTREKYRFAITPGDKEVAARHDFVLLAEAAYDADRMNLVELKKDQPKLSGSGDEIDCPAVRKDFQKLILEPAAHGKSMIHMLHAASTATVPSVLRKYNAAIWQGLKKSRPFVTRLGLSDPLDDPAWFTLFILVVRQRGRSGGNRPVLYHQHIENLGEALRRVEGGDQLFQKQLLTSDQLTEA